MGGLTMNTARCAAIVSGVFWLFYLVLVMVELSGKVPYTAAYKAIGLATGVLQAAPIVIVAGFLAQAEALAAWQEAIKALKRIADNPREDEQVRVMVQQILGGVTKRRI